MWRVSQIVWPLAWTYKDQPAPPQSLPQQSLPLVATLDRNRIIPQIECPLFLLSTEIRHRIYSLVLQTYCDTESPNSSARFPWRPDLTGHRRVDTALLSTCRSIYTETWAIPLLQTTLVIHEGSDEDRPDPFVYPVHPKNGQPLFHLQAWQVLLLQRVDMTFQQIRFDGGGMTEWLGRLHEARRRSRQIVQLLAAKKPHRDPEMTKSFVEKSLLDLSLESVTVRLNRKDWWTWSNDPMDPGSDLELHAWKGRILRLHIDEEPFRLPNWEEENNDVPLFADNFEFVLKLETFGVKAAQLNRVVNKAKNWVFAMPRCADMVAAASKQVIWDGEVVDESFVKREESDSHINWLINAGEDARKVAVRVVRFVPKTVS